MKINITKTTNIHKQQDEEHDEKTKIHVQKQQHL